MSSARALLALLLVTSPVIAAEPRPLSDRSLTRLLGYVRFFHLSDQELISGASPQWRRFRGLSDLLRGPEGQEVRLDIQPREGAPFSTTLARSVTRLPVLEKAVEILLPTGD